MEVGIIVATCHAYVMWAELGHSHFLYVPTVSNVVTIGNGTGTKNVLINRTVHLDLCYYCSESKPISTRTWSTVSFYFM